MKLEGAGIGTSGRRSASTGSRGSTVRAKHGAAGLHIPGTVVAAAERGARAHAGGVPLLAADLRGAEKRGTESNMVVFLVDASGSMAARDRLSAVTGAVTSLLRDAYQKRDKVAVVAFRGSEAEVVLPPTKSIDIAVRRLENLATGGRTPLAEGLISVEEILARERRREPERRAMLVVLSDGRATGKDGRLRARTAADSIRRKKLAGSIVIDCESGRVKLGLAGELATSLGGTVVSLNSLDADSVAGVVRAGI